MSAAVTKLNRQCLVASIEKSVAVRSTCVHNVHIRIHVCMDMEMHKCNMKHVHADAHADVHANVHVHVCVTCCARAHGTVLRASAALRAVLERRGLRPPSQAAAEPLVSLPCCGRAGALGKRREPQPSCCSCRRAASGTGASGPGAAVASRS